MLQISLKKWSQYSAFFLVLFFLIQTIFLATKLEFGMAPDEVFHYNQIQNFHNSRNFLLSSNDILTYRNPDISPAPMGQAYYLVRSKSSFTYHWLMGRLLYFNIFAMSDLLFLRLINLLLSILYFLYFYKLAKLILKNNILVIFAMLLHVMLPMFMFVSSAISYDNLLNLLSMLSIYYLFLLIEKNNIEHALLVLLFMSIGVSVKFTVLPLVVALFILLVVHLIKHRVIWGVLMEKFCEHKKKYIFFLVLFLLTLSLNIYIYFRNFFIYKSFIPNCISIFDFNTCWQEDYIFQRNQIFINSLIKPVAGVNNFLSYSYNWLDKMIYTNINFAGHNPGILVVSNIFIVKLFIFIFLVSFFIKNKNIEKKIRLSLFIAIFYALVLLLYNYKGFLLFGHPFMAIQGRYIFPVISLMFILFSQYFLSFIKDKNLRYFMIFGLTLILFFYINFVILVKLF